MFIIAKNVIEMKKRKLLGVLIDKKLDSSFVAVGNNAKLKATKDAVNQLTANFS
jgi:hypothetical protein